MAKKILIVEDDKFLRELIVERLKKEGFETIGAVDAEEGFKKLKDKKSDLVLLDLILPGMDGFEFLAKLKKDPDFSAIPVIILSNLGQEQDVVRGKELGAVDYLIKAHFTPSEIIEKVKNALK